MMSFSYVHVHVNNSESGRHHFSNFALVFFTLLPHQCFSKEPIDMWQRFPNYTKSSLYV